MKRMPCVLMGSVAAMFLLVTAWPASPAKAQEAAAKIDLAVRPEFREPVTLASKDGVLEVRLIAKQGTATLDTVAKPVQNMLVLAYELIRGTSSDGKASGDNLYPAPTLQVFPGETLIIHLDNALTGLTIKDFFDPAYTAKGEEVPLYPSQMTASPLNLHVHGVHVSPKGNADNVLLHIPGGKSNTYTYNIPKSMPQGAYWYHSHLHTLTAMHVYYGMVGLLAIGRTDGNLPLVTQNQIPIRNMLLQYNYVFDRAGGSTKLNNYTWSQWVNTTKPPQGDALAKGTYRPLLAPVNFLDSTKGTEFFTGILGRCRSATSAGGLSSSLAICSASRPSTAPTRSCRPIQPCPITSATFSSPSMASSSRWSRARRGRPRSGCSPMSATSSTRPCS
jgi:FtsP/CotA-like multicopper oxidase with cupredoxin domain